MKVPGTFKTQEDCLGCVWRSEGFFCDLPNSELRQFSSYKITHAYPRGTALFTEGQPANGVYMLCAGRVKLSTYSEEGRSLIVRVAEPGEILGLSACVAGVTHEGSAQVIADCQVNFVRRSEFLSLLKNNSAAAMNAIRELSHLYHKAHAQICSLGLSVSAGDKLAKLLLDWSKKCDDGGAGVSIEMLYTHEEVAEMIGTSRETVTRMLKIFKDRGLIQIIGPHLLIPDKRRLRGAIGHIHLSPPGVT
jgi:CRP/FNR family transcriptional regulator, cyclic AMP receptor protein